MTDAETGHAELAPDDVVETHEHAAGNERAPLVVLEPLVDLLDGAGLGRGALTVEPIGFGHSNVTLLIRREGWEAVLRRPPRGPIQPSAHDILREARIMKALESTPVPVPEIFITCSDESLIGAPFVVMERLHGHVISDAVPHVLDSPAQRGRIGEVLIDALVELHALDWSTPELVNLGRPNGYLERQLRRFRQLWEINATHELPLMEEIGDWLSEHVPVSPAPTVVHGDYRLGNVVLAPAAEVRIVGILDWEMATLGDPLADLGYLMTTWPEAGDQPDPFEVSSVTRQEGFQTRAELVARYVERSGREADNLRWYEALAHWKVAVFMEGNYKRYLAGSVADPFVAGFGDGVRRIAETAASLTVG